MNSEFYGFPKNTWMNSGFNGFPIKRKTNESFYGFPKNDLGAYDIYVNMYNISEQYFRLYLKCDIETTILIDLGNRIESFIISTDYTLVQLKYLESGFYRIQFIDNYQHITGIKIYPGWEGYVLKLFSNPSKFEKTLKHIEFKKCTNLTSCGILSSFEVLETLDFEGSSQLYVNFSELPTCTTLITFNMWFTKIYGNISDLSNCLNLVTYIVASSTSVYNVTGNIFNVDNLIYLEKIIIVGSFDIILPTLENCPNLNTYNISCYGSVSGYVPRFSNNTLIQFILIKTQVVKNIVDTLPDFLNNTNLELIDLTNMGLTGSISNITNLINLRVISLGGNKLTGTIPSFSNFPNLGMNLSYNLNIDYAFGIYNQAYGVVSFAGNVGLVSNGLDFSQNPYFRYLDVSGSGTNAITGITGNITFPTNPLLPYIYIYMHGTNISGTLDSIASGSTIWAMVTSTQMTGVFPTISFSDAGYNSLNASLSQFTSFLNFITYLYNIRKTYNILKNVNISGANNATPGGTYQAPSGYIQSNSTTAGNDGTPASEKEMIYVLVNQCINYSETKKYKYIFTTN